LHSGIALSVRLWFCKLRAINYLRRQLTPKKIYTEILADLHP